MGASGLVVSSLGLGTMTWGRDTPADEAFKQLEAFIEAGGNFVDTSPTYGLGVAEELLGQFLRDMGNRPDCIIATKAGFSVVDGHVQADTSRGALLRNLDESLTRLQTDYVDLWLVQNHDGHTSIDETLSALNAAVQSGKARYVGLSNYPAWAVTQAATLLSPRVSGLSAPGLAAVEMEYSLLQRGIEAEIVSASQSLGFGIIGWSALGRGILTGKYRSTTPPDSRAASSHLRGFVEPYMGESSRRVVEALATAAQGLDIGMIDAALAWLDTREHLACSIVGARSADQLSTILKATGTQLPPQLVAVLDEVSAPVVGYPARWR